ncbi:conserved hypothetical protein [Burkholderia pseudomallei 305]|nr:conserved hypothetical protein [Burkholderia pseudomallei 305]
MTRFGCVGSCVGVRARRARASSRAARRRAMRGRTPGARRRARFNLL